MRKTRRDDPDWRWNRVEQINEIVSTWGFHSRQSEATLHAVLYALPHELIPFVRERVRVFWKRRTEVALLLRLPDNPRAYVIVLDTKLENESPKLREAALALRIAEAYLEENPEISSKPEKLVRSWGIDLDILEADHVHEYRKHLLNLDF